MQARLRSVLVVVAAGGVVVAATLLLRSRTGDPADPAAARSDPTAARASSPDAVERTAVPGEPLELPVTEPAGGAPGREETEPNKRAPATIGGMTPAEIADHAREMLALDAAAPLSDTGDAAVEASEQHAAWSAHMRELYSDLDEKQKAAAIRKLQAVLDWQRWGPFEGDEQILPKEQLEMYARELQWLRER